MDATTVAALEDVAGVSVLAGLGGSAAVAAVVFLVNWWNIRRQKTMDSASLARDLHRPWRNSDQFKAILLKVNQ